MSDKYIELHQLGKGSYGTVFQVREKSNRGKKWCMKKINLKGLQPKERQAAFLEVKLLRELRHPHVVSFHDSFVNRATNHLCLVMTFCEGGDLHRKVQERKKNNTSFSEGRVVGWLLQITLALQYIHERHNIIHRDLKTQNVFLLEDGNTIKLGDFGVSRVLDKPTDLARTCVGTPFYMCPELMRKQRYSNKADMWALGCVLYELTTLRHAFDAQDMHGLAMKIVRGKYPPIPSSYTKDLSKICAELLHTTPSSRPSAGALLMRPLMQGAMQKHAETAAAANLAFCAEPEEPPAKPPARPPEPPARPPPPPPPPAPPPASAATAWWWWCSCWVRRAGDSAA